MADRTRSPSSDRQLQRLVDGDDIRALSHRYAQAADLHDYSTMSALFTADGAMSFDRPWAVDGESRRTVYRGAEAIRAMPAPPLHRGLHVATNIHIVWAEGDDEATGAVYFVRLTPHAEGGLRISNAGVYRDRYQRTSDGWAFAWRDILPMPADGLPADAFCLPTERHP